MSVNSDFSQFSASNNSTASISSNESRSSTYSHQFTSSTINNSVDKIINTLNKCEESYGQLIFRKLIYRHLEDVVKNSQLIIINNDNNNSNNSKLEMTLNKLKQGLSAHRIDKYYSLPTKYKQKDDKLTILGIVNKPAVEWNHEEKKILKIIVERELLKTINSYIHKYEENGGNLIEAMKYNESIMKQELLKINELDTSYWKDKLDDICNEYRRDIYVCADLLNEWRRLKSEDVEDLNYKRAQLKNYDIQITELQINIAKVKYSLKIFSEAPETVEAFKMVDRKLDEKLIEVQTEIKRKKALSKLYHDLQGTEYDDILKRYLELRAAIKREERLLNNL